MTNLDLTILHLDEDTLRRIEAEVLDAIVRGMPMARPDDDALTSHTDVLYDGLYAYLSREVL